MAETDIFNPTNWTAAGLIFNPNPSSGFTRKMGANRQLTRPRLGIYPTRDIENGGHIFQLGWINTDLTIAERIVQFYHNFKDGYFTLIDQDWNQRQYVGRFMNEPEGGHTANGKWTYQGIQFEEMPRARMLVYPSLALYGHPLNVADDYLSPRAALVQGAWAIQVSPLAPGGSTTSTPSALEAIDVTPAAGDYAATAYTGFGFEMNLRCGAAMGKVTVYLDLVGIVVGLDLSNGTYVSVATGVTVTPTSVSGVLSYVTVAFTNVWLDLHRVMIQYVGASAAGGVSITFPQLTYAY
jgi:hypothetical protein